MLFLSECKLHIVILVYIGTFWNIIPSNIFAPWLVESGDTESGCRGPTQDTGRAGQNWLAHCLSHRVRLSGRRLPSACISRDPPRMSNNCFQGLGIPEEGQMQHTSPSKPERVDFPGGPVVKTPCCQCRGPRFDPWLGNCWAHVP